MRFKIDENLPGELVELLEGAGHDAHTVRDEKLVGSPDPSLLAVCVREGRVLVTLELGFGDIRAYPPDTTPGLVVLRPCSQLKGHVLALVRRILGLIETESLAGKLWVVEENRVRIRGS
jgi:predicted nuclease of predicted toxin-antitoxin system